jgi:uncharacterized membrane protein YkoI
LFNARTLGTEAVMKTFLASLCALSALALVVPAAPLHADTDGEQGAARRQRQAGNILSIRQIESQVLPRMSGMQYLGPEYNPEAMAYRLKFIQDGKVHFVDVDARSGRVIGQSR